MYAIALFLHLSGVVVLVAAVTTTLLATLRSQTAESVEQVRTLAATAAKVDLVIGPAMLLILAPGLYMVSRHGHDGSIRWTSGWVDVAVVVFALMAVLGPAVESRHAKRTFRLAGQLPDGPVPPELEAACRAPVGTYVTLFGVSQIFAFLYLMTSKPPLVGAITAVVLAGLLSTVVATIRLRGLATR